VQYRSNVLVRTLRRSDHAAEGRPLRTLRGAANHVIALPKAESTMPHWQIAVRCLMAAAEKCAPVKMARIAVVKALDGGKAVEIPQLLCALKNRKHPAIQNDKRPQKEF
jgi:hypothetical protein